MHTFEVWAPNASRVEVRLGDALIPLRLRERGYWSVEVSAAQAGDDYGYVLDGHLPPIPDPRSPFQPHGVNGLSRLVDHARFAWTDSEWEAQPLSAAIIYELHIGTFTAEGTFDSAIGKLDYLCHLGITHIEIMPVNEFPGSHGWGYDGVDLYAPHHAYGGPDGLKRLVNACHKKGLAVLLDVVYNHLGPVGNYLSKFGPYFNEAYHTPWGAAVNLDGPGSTEARKFFCDNALMWLRDYHFDGLRIDAVHAFLDRSAIHFLEQLAVEAEALSAKVKRRLVLIAESDLNQPLVVTPRAQHGFGIDAQWSDDFHHALHSVLTGERDGYYEDFGSLAQLAKSLKSVFVFDGAYSSFRQRNHGRPVENLPGTRFLGYLQNHDQIGNRAQGERSSHLLNYGQLKIAAALVLLGPFIPMLFQGEEFATSAPFQYFTDHEETEIGRAVTEGRRREFEAFGWDPDQVPDPQNPETFSRSHVNWDELAQEPHQAVLDWHRKLIHLRRSNADFINGDLSRLEVYADEHQRTLVLIRGRFTIVCNLSSEPVSHRVHTPAVLLLASDSKIKVQADTLFLTPDSVGILEHSQ